MKVMAKNMHKEQWIEEVMNSTQHMVPAQPSARLFENIRLNMDNAATIKIVSFPVRQWAAAAVLLLSLNIGSVVWFTAQHKKTDVAGGETRLAAQIQSETTYNY